MQKFNTLLLVLIALFTGLVAFRPRTTMNLIRLRLSLPKSQAVPADTNNVANTEPAKEPVASSTTRPDPILTPDNKYDHEDVLLGRVHASTLRPTENHPNGNGSVATLTRPATETVTNPVPAAPTHPVHPGIPAAVKPAVTKAIPPTTTDDEPAYYKAIPVQPSRRLRYSLLAAAVIGSIGLLVLTYALGDTDRKIKEVASMGGTTIQRMEVSPVDGQLPGTTATRYYHFERNMRHVADSSVEQAIVIVKPGYKVRAQTILGERDYSPGEKFAATSFDAYEYQD